VGASTSHNPIGLHGLLQGYLYLTGMMMMMMVVMVAVKMMINIFDSTDI
jgi:hypothetical protein